MKFFTHVDGIFEIQIPLDWYYKNDITGYENKSPYSFERIDNQYGCFQISCYHKTEKCINLDLPKGNYDTKNLKFAELEYPDPKFKTFIWATVVEDYFFMAKYICQPTVKNFNEIKNELIKVEKSLSTLMCLSPERRDYAIGFDRYEKFTASLAASVDLKNRAIENESFIELVILSSNQIDAYLRLCIVLKIQIIENTELFKLEYLYQGENDKPIMEKKVYDKSKEMNIITDVQFDKLYELYNLRNKVVHRYIISDIKTKEILEIVLAYENICEDIRIVLKKIENEQYEKGLGYHKFLDPKLEKDSNIVNELYSRVNEKHFLKGFYRDI